MNFQLKIVNKFISRSRPAVIEPSLNLSFTGGMFVNDDSVLRSLKNVERELFDGKMDLSMNTVEFRT